MCVPDSSKFRIPNCWNFWNSEIFDGLTDFKQLIILIVTIYNNDKLLSIYNTAQLNLN